MKKLFQRIGLLLFLVSFSYLANANSENKSVKNNKNTIDETRPVTGFSGVSSAGSYHIFISMGSTESLRLEGDAEDIAEVETKVENGVLKISRKNKLNRKSWTRTHNVNIYIEAKTINSLTLAGSGDINVSGTIHTEKLTNTISGSGSISLEMNVRNYVALISGSGEIKAAGKAEKSLVSIAGSGEFHGESLKSDEADLKLSGSGDIDIFVNKNLKAAISGSGDIRYGGNPNVSYTKSGSGSISKL